MKKFTKYAFIGLVFLILFTAFALFSGFLFPFTSSKGFYFRVVIELALPFYLYLVLADASLRPKLKQPLTLAVLAFFLLSLISAVFGVDFLRSVWGTFERMDSVFMLAHLLLLYFYILLLGKISGGALEKLLKLVVIVSTFSAINGISGYLGGPILAPDSFLPSRASSFFGNPIFFASFLILPATLAVFFAFREESRRLKYVYWAALLLHLAGFYASVTRGAAVGLVGGILVGAVLYLVFQKNLKARRRGFYALLAAFACIGILFLARGVLPENSDLRRFFRFQDTNTQSRLLQWRTALKGFKDNPVLGVGLNNYYFVSNKHYDPEIWKYDKEWFDKPHNYQLELLATTGLTGLAAYGAAVLFALFALYRAYDKGLVSLLEASVLAGGLAAYQFQNLFVFDTVTASMAYYLFLGFVAFLYSETEDEKSKKAQDRPGLAQGFLWVGIPMVLYSAYAFNWTGGQIARNLNFAKLLTQTDFTETKMLLDKSANTPFNFYWRDVAYEYSNFAAWWSNRNQDPAQLEKSKAMMEDAVKFSKKAADAHPNDPTVLLKYANAYFARAHLNNTGFSQEAYDLAFKAHQFSEKKSDPKMFMAGVAIEGKKPELAEPWLLEVIADFPGFADPKWQLADLYYFSGRKDQAVKLAEEALAQGFVLDSIKKGDWYLIYYYDAGQPQKVLDYLLSQAKGKEKDSDYFARLADAYNKTGNFKEARIAALKVLELDPASQADVEAFLKALPQ